MMIRYGCAALILAAGLYGGIGVAQTAPAKPDPAGWVAPPVTTPEVLPPVAPAPPVATPAAKSDNLPFPKWSEFPVPPTDVPTIPEIAQRVKVENDHGRMFTAEVNALVWDKDVPEPYAEATRNSLDPELSKPVDVAQAQKDIRDILSHHVVPPPLVKD